MAYYNTNIKSIFKEFATSQKGLSNTAAEEKLAKFGKNSFEKTKKIGFFVKFLQQFKNIMIIILLLSAIISTTTAAVSHNTESLFEGLLIFAIVIINAIVGVFQEQKAENALSALEKKIEPFSKVFRNGNLINVKTSEVVVGDVVELKAGDAIPADIRIISCNQFKCDESSLTGESQPVEKFSNEITKQNVPLAEQFNMCFSGTTVVHGSATGVVVATGKDTEIGKIAKILTKTIKEKTPLEKNIDKLGKAITFAVLGIAVIVFIVQSITQKQTSFLDHLLTAVALAVAAIPESLPAVITIIMALGVEKLANQNAIVKKLSAVETLGCCNVICSDKTGTLTQNKMTVNGIYTNLKFQSKLEPIQNEKFIEIASTCISAKFNEKGEIFGDATEISIIQFLQNNNINCKNISNKFKILQINEFNSKTKIMSTVVEKDGKKSLFVKGAFDYIFPKCSQIEINGLVENFDKNLKNKIVKQNENFCENGERVLAFAYKRLETPSDDDLIFVGLVSISDPPKADAVKAVETSKRAGLKTIMITGDHPTTAFAIAKKLKIAKNKNEVLTGAELDKISVKQLSKIIENYSVFARVTPEHKLMIVKALKRNGKIVAMTGDGVNDAPSIRAANIGTAMGQTGTDVTKEVSDIIISDDNFSTIVVAIKQGRTIYQNITKTILFLMSTNIVEVLGIFVTSLVMPGNVFLTASQILFINLVTDSLPAFALGIEPPEPDIMTKKPRDPNKSILSGKTGSSIIYQGFIQSLLVLVMFVLSVKFFSEKQASTMVFMTICLMQIIHAINCKTEKSLFKINPFNNKFFNFSFIFLLLMILGVYFIPFFANLFSLVSLSGIEMLIVAICSISIIPLVEIGKIFIKQ
ncbi:MAG: calcium-translocating P-type ATPase, PMCA-type [Clostridia bacterium]|nr:calcium-translocating P-type ATPase, PMCA-type [Clostridia bacterium]